jgi:S-adenosylmethionine:tRNA ribosyltransferase-isomerase
MKTADFDYPVPEQAIAYHPRPRGSSRLCVLDRAKGTDTFDTFVNIAAYLPDHAVLVLNNTKVFNARLFAHDSKGREIEVFVLERLTETDFVVLLRPKKKLSADSLLMFSKDVTLTATMLDFANNVIRFSRAMTLDAIDAIGEVPLPKYIKRSGETRDTLEYQTVYAAHTGSIAAPTAGFHFTKEILAKLASEKHIEIVYVTHHIGYATFKPIEAESPVDHDMLPEWYTIPQSVAAAVNTAKREGRKVIAVGTSSVRPLESSADEHGFVKAEERSTRLFIYPGYRFKTVDHMLTNFHLPRSAPLMMVSALAGKERIHRAYAQALVNDFKFYSYGDAMLIV